MLNPNTSIPYRGFQIAVELNNARFTARVSCEGSLINHDGRSSEVWASESCGSYDRAISVAKKAIDDGRIGARSA